MYVPESPNSLHEIRLVPRFDQIAAEGELLSGQLTRGTHNEGSFQTQAELKWSYLPEQRERAADFLKLHPSPSKWLLPEPQVIVLKSGVLLGSSGVPASGDFVVPRATLRGLKFLREFGIQEGSGRSISRFAAPEVMRGESEVDCRGGLLLGPGEFENHYHFLFDCFARAFVYRHVTGSLPSRIVVVGKSLSSHRANWIEVLYSALGQRIPDVRTIHLTRGAVVKVSNLAISTSCTAHLSMFAPLLLEAMEEIGDCFLIRPAPAAISKIFVGRGSARSRRLVNDVELREVFHEREVTVVDGERMTPSQQVSATVNASVIVGVHGAGLANAVFSRHCRKLVELLPEGFGDASPYCALALAKGIEYFPVFGTLDSIQRPAAAGVVGKSNNSNFTVSAKHLAAAIDGLDSITT